MRLIDADALIEYLKKTWGKWDKNDWYEAQAKDAMKDDIEIVNEQPTVDAVPVVRCKDCKHADHKDCADGFCWCDMYGGTTDNFFCADGERRSK